MSLENTDSTEDKVNTNQSNQFCQENKIPPLISNSPPPHLDDYLENDERIGSFQENQNLSDLDNSANSCNISLPNMKPLSFVEDTARKSNAVKTLESMNDNWDAFSPEIDNSKNDMPLKGVELNQIDTHFDPFNTNQVSQSNVIAFANDTDTSDWANFDQNAFTFPSSGPVENQESLFTEEAIESRPDNSNSIQTDTTDSNVQITKSDSDKKGFVEDDDDFGEIVELETKVLPVIESQSSIANQIQQDLNSSIEKLLNLCAASLNESGSGHYLENEEFLIEANETWQQLQVLTSTTDESDSLQFKWNLSSLETDYLNSLNMTRVLPQIKRDWSYNNILQPVKVNALPAIKIPETSAVNITLEASDLPKTPTTNPSNFTDFESLKLHFLGSNTTPNTGLTTPALDIDLSFFEGSPEPTKKYDPKLTPNVSRSMLDLENGSRLSVQNNQITGISSTKQEVSSKVYLDSLLADIFSKPSQPISTSDPKKDDEFFSCPDKKSLSSSSTSSSMSNLSEQSIQLQPKNLEMLIQQDLINARHTYDEKALKISSRLPPNTTYSHSKVMVFNPK